MNRRRLLSFFSSLSALPLFGRKLLVEKDASEGHDLYRMGAGELRFTVKDPTTGLLTEFFFPRVHVAEMNLCEEREELRDELVLISWPKHWLDLHFETEKVEIDSGKSLCEVKQYACR